MLDGGVVVSSSDLRAWASAACCLRARLRRRKRSTICCRPKAMIRPMQMVMRWRYMWSDPSMVVCGHGIADLRRCGLWVGGVEARLRGGWTSSMKGSRDEGWWLAALGWAIGGRGAFPMHLAPGGGRGQSRRGRARGHQQLSMPRDRKHTEGRRRRPRRWRRRERG